MITFARHNPAEDFIHSAVRTLESLVHPDDSDFVADRITTCVDQGQSWDIDYRIIHREGQVRWMHEKGRAIFEHDGSLAYLNGFVHDITERHRQAAFQEMVATILDGAYKVAERIRAAVRRFAIPHEIAGAERVTVSVGATPLQQPELEMSSPTELLQTADQALYRAKEQGRDQVVAMSLPQPSRSCLPAHS